MVWWLASAWAGVVLDDPAGCVHEEALRLELGEVLRQAQAESATVTVRLGTGLELAVHQGERPLWARSLSVEAGVCDVLHLLVARSVEQGLAELPDWAFAGPTALPPDLAVAVTAGVSPTPAPLAWGALVVGTGPLSGRGRWQAGAELLASTVRSRGGRGAQLLGATARIGPAIDVGRGARRLRLGLTWSAGPVLVAPEEPLELAGPRVVPGARIEAQGSLVGPGAGMVSVWVDAPVLRVQINDVGTGETLREAVIRGGIRVGVRGRLRGGR